MPIDVDKALNAPPRTQQLAWTTRDVLLYHLSLGSGTDLRYGYERDLEVLPTFALVAGQGISAGDRPAEGLTLPGVDVDLTRLLHAGQVVTLHRDRLPTSGSAERTTRIAEIQDKGKAAVIVLAHEVADADGPLWTSKMSIWARGEGGFGGDPGTAAGPKLPDGDPTHVLDVATTPDQALLYRLNGDRNPLHADPEVAAKAGFEAPILHGLASYGLVAKAVVDHFLDGRPARLRELGARFAGPVIPGQTLRISVWQQESDLRLKATCGDAAVLADAWARTTPGDA
ncbi:MULTISPECIES: MaoC family dehydratase [Amycolatopsis]|uniref:MaoC family dehydratase N-terminal domain-containing protein n=1 Tax=Amycolatopsis dendrobii TaxID=2760662 RepID=A0A7W3W005_9PSEU|nr:MULTISPECIES: MaoC family dehydratase [Amycolatopsis]MBB1156260.1 MaoC family dehydratase N-terminal domain-containing protein [Amycolatopsis dendrobii]UKD58784.1 3-alpha,7-alpha,12-alpha-trihydroxy-5-beta-cholest-24-enoyl-CoA hydratase [Amycolatopsis sp. FU40]